MKSYRYGIHLFIFHILGIKKFLNVGDGKKADYEIKFSSYVLKKLKHLNLSTSFGKEQIDQWFEQSEIQSKIEEMFCMNIIRWQFGRAIELWILLDRACFLEEAGYKVKMGEYFNENISPRNIGIFAKITSERKASLDKLEGANSQME